MAKKTGLGKGLDALFEDIAPQSQVVMLRLTQVEPNKEQPRKDFDDEKLLQLADSIREKGVLQPLIVRPLLSGGYKIVAGERRWRAGRMAGLSEIPAIVRELSDLEAAEIALIENLQREDLNPIEEAAGYNELIEKFKLTQEQLANRLGKSRPAVANALRLLSLPEEVREFVASKEISPGHARALLSVPEKSRQIALAKEIKEKGLSVREIEKTARAQSGPAQTAPSKPSKLPGLFQDGGDSFYREMELALQEELGRKIKIEMRGNKGILQIEFYNKEELSDIAQRLSQS